MSMRPVSSRADPSQQDPAASRQSERPDWGDEVPAELETDSLSLVARAHRSEAGPEKSFVWGLTVWPKMQRLCRQAMLPTGKLHWRCLIDAGAAAAA